jgi:hypothetical protein
MITANAQWTGSEGRAAVRGPARDRVLVYLPLRATLVLDNSEHLVDAATPLGRTTPGQRPSGAQMPSGRLCQPGASAAALPWVTRR